MSVKCGSCKSNHESTAEVRACYGQIPFNAPATSHPLAEQPKAPELTNYSLLIWAEQQTWSEFAVDVARKARSYGGRLSDGQRRALLKMYNKQQERKGSTTRQTDPDLPAGYYAIRNFEGHEIRFFVVQEGKGRWEGRKFLKEQAGSELYRVYGARADQVVAEIAKDVDGAGHLYGQELGRCRYCNRELTDDLSRELSAGPVCRADRGL